ncbi:MAG: phenylacetate--CoA ligase family protein, partial [Bacteroidota bacterium]|nr:phenylacetate--CoA ligase family protein [Bacteroidota bacterium]
PLLIALTKNDIQKTVEVGSDCFRSSGLNSSHIVIHCLNYNMWAGGYTDHQSLETTGATVIPFGVGNSVLLIETIMLIKPTVIHCTPSYLKKLEIILRETFNKTPKSLGLKLGLFGAEPGLQNPDYRNHLQETWGLKAMNANYGLSDVLSMFGAECEFQNGLHFFGENTLYPELLDNNSGQIIPIKEGAKGELVLTNLCKEAQPLIRYKTNDIIKILSTGRCECGRSNFRFEVVGRTDDMIKIKGLNVFMSSIDRIINNNLNYLNGVYQVLVNKNEPVDRILIKVELKNDIEDLDKFKINFNDEFMNKIFIKPEIEYLHDGFLPRTEGKTKKLFKIL